MLKTVQEVLPTAVEDQQGCATVYAVYTNGKRVLIVEPHGESWTCSVSHGFGHAPTLREAVAKALQNRLETVATLREIEDRVYQDISGLGSCHPKRLDLVCRHSLGKLPPL
jgi:hypothetical protein